MDKNYCRTSTVRILGTTLCCHCGEEVQVEEGSYHRNENDEDYCTCAGSLGEKEMRIAQSKLRNQIDKIENDIVKTLRKSEHIFNKSAYKLEMDTLNATLKRKYGVVEDSL